MKWNKRTTRDLSRRDFVKTTTVGIGATVLTGVGARDARAGQAPRSWDRTADVVIIGAGATGLPAAIEAAEHGASVIVVEQNFDVGGQAIQSGANLPLGGGTTLQKKYGIEDSADRYFEDLIRNPDYRYSDRDLLRVFSDWSAPTFEWLLAHGIEVPDRAPRGDTVGRTQTLVWTGGASAVSPTGAPGTALVRPLEAAARKLGVQILLAHRMTTIIRERPFSGQVFGVAATHQGKTVHLQAGKGVIIGTGGHASNVEFRRMFDPRITEEYQVVGEPYGSRTGDGEIAALQIGAAFWATANQTLERGQALSKGDQIGCQFTNLTPGNYLGPLSKIAASPIFDRIRAVGLTVKDYQNLIHVNRLGRRFVNETASGYEWITPCMAADGGASNGGGPIWAIFDADAVKREDWVCQPPWVDPGGWFFTGSTLAELASKIENKYQKQPMPARALEEAVARYNSFVDAGEDADFGKPSPKYKIQTSPFYAAWGTPCADESLTGLRINARSQVIDMYGQVIPGLYCGGESAGGFNMHGLARCMIQGRIAGRDVAQLNKSLFVGKRA